MLHIGIPVGDIEIVFVADLFYNSQSEAAPLRVVAFFKTVKYNRGFKTGGGATVDYSQFTRPEPYPNEASFDIMPDCID